MLNYIYSFQKEKWFDDVLREKLMKDSVDEALHQSIDQLWLKTRFIDKESSRQASFHARYKLRAAIRSGADLEDKNPSEETVYQLSRIEHARWCADHLLKGFCALTDFPQRMKDPSIKTSLWTNRINAKFETGSGGAHAG